MYFTNHDATPINGHVSFLPQAARTAIADDSADRSHWDKCMAEYLRTRALVLAVFEYGPLAKANKELEWLEASLAHQFGRDFKCQPEASEVWEPALKRVNELDREMVGRFARPHWEAQRALVQCPAPDLAAALFKADMVQIDDAANDGGLKGDAFQYVAADLERFAP